MLQTEGHISGIGKKMLLPLSFSGSTRAQEVSQDGCNFIQDAAFRDRVLIPCVGDCQRMLPMR